MNKNIMKTILWEIDQRGAAQVKLNRPQLHNAFNEEMIAELIEAFTQLRQLPEVRLVTLTGEGSSFCAGADLNWMKRMKDYGPAENLADSQRLAQLFSTINDFPLPVIALVNGHTLGGGAGLVSCCDYVLAVAKAKFGFTEVRLGLLPAVISPFVVAKIGESWARAFFMSGEKFSAQQALQMQLIHEVVDDEQLLQQRGAEVVQSFLQAAPMASVQAKALIQMVLEGRKKERDIARKELTQKTTELIAKVRAGEEAQVGMLALLDKKNPPWQKQK